MAIYNCYIISYCNNSWSLYTRNFIKDLIENNLVEKKNYYYWLGWNFRNYSDKKKKRIEQRLESLNEMKEV